MTRTFAPWLLGISPGMAGAAVGAIPSSVSGSPAELVSLASTGTAALSPARMTMESSWVVIWSALGFAGTTVTLTVPVALLRPSLTV